MADLAPTPNQYTIRFKGFMERSITVARQRIETEGIDAPISDEARARAQNVLSYTLQEAEVWPTTRDLLLTMAPKMEMAGYRNDWLPYLEMGLTRSQSHKDYQAQAELQLHIGHLYRLLSDFTRAGERLRASITTFINLKDRYGQARALNQMAYVAYAQQEYDEAKKLAEGALELVDKVDIERAMSLSVLGIVALEHRNWQEAEFYHREALQIRTRQGRRRQIAWSLQNLGYALRGQKKFDLAISSYEQAIAILQEVQDPGNCAIAYMNLGITYSVTGQPEQSIKLYELAESSFRNLHDLLNLAKVLTSKGLDYTALSAWENAERAFIESIELFRTLGHTGWRLNAADGLGLVYLRQGNADKAREIFVAALAELPQILGTPRHKYLATVLPMHLAEAE